MAFDACPLHNLTRKGVPWHWSDEFDVAFESLRTVYLENTVLVAQIILSLSVSPVKRRIIGNASSFVS